MATRAPSVNNKGAFDDEKAEHDLPEDDPGWKVCLLCLLDVFATIARATTAVGKAVIACARRVIYPVKSCLYSCMDRCAAWYEPYKKRMPAARHISTFEFGLDVEAQAQRGADKAHEHDRLF
eukprot:NODE_25079_length_600_cov_3.084567.p2 GENE.NODE_25079_length_600_cov_3.084567~~NODE_25079_length_600_cov_3.084567.p2  ORF type:complete len:122 (-),score=11.56 NODE_25079_length_600_cov_3.084567:161-526(-)